MKPVVEKEFAIMRYEFFCIKNVVNIDCMDICIISALSTMTEKFGAVADGLNYLSSLMQIKPRTMREHLVKLRKMNIVEWKYNSHKIMFIKLNEKQIGEYIKMGKTMEIESKNENPFE